jgi:hypothetical protein
MEAVFARLSLFEQSLASLLGAMSEGVSQQQLLAPHSNQPQQQLADTELDTTGTTDSKPAVDTATSVVGAVEKDATTFSEFTTKTAARVLKEYQAALSDCPLPELGVLVHEAIHALRQYPHSHRYELMLLKTAMHMCAIGRRLDLAEQLYADCVHTLEPILSEISLEMMFHLAQHKNIDDVIKYALVPRPTNSTCELALLMICSSTRGNKKSSVESVLRAVDQHRLMLSPALLFSLVHVAVRNPVRKTQVAVGMVLARALATVLDTLSIQRLLHALVRKGYDLAILNALDECRRVGSLPQRVITAQYTNLFVALGGMLGNARSVRSSEIWTTQRLALETILQLGGSVPNGSLSEFVCSTPASSEHLRTVMALLQKYSIGHSFAWSRLLLACCTLAPELALDVLRLNPSYAAPALPPRVANSLILHLSKKNQTSSLLYLLQLFDEHNVYVGHRACCACINLLALGTLDYTATIAALQLLTIAERTCSIKPQLLIRLIDCIDDQDYKTVDLRNRLIEHAESKGHAIPPHLQPRP